MPRTPATAGRTAKDQERRLVRAIREGDRAAFDALILPHLSALQARTRRAVRSRPDVDADDIVQETLVRSFEAFHLYDERYDFEQYLFGIAKYALRRRLSASMREIAVAWDEAVEDAGNGPVLPLAESLPAAARALAGADRFPRPDERALASARLRELLEAVLAYGGYPHQQVAFAYATVLWGKRKADAAAPDGCGHTRERPDKSPVTSDPDRVVRELSETPLAIAGREFRREIEAIGAAGASDFAEAFRPFEHRLGLTIRELFARDRASLRTFGALGERRTGDTRLADYYGRDARRSVSDWIDAVKTRVRKYLTGRLDLSRSPFPMPPPPHNLGEDR